MQRAAQLGTPGKDREGAMREETELTAARPSRAPRADWSRRDFLRVAGMAVGGVVGGPVLAACSTSSSSSSGGTAQITFSGARCYGKTDTHYSNGAPNAQ